MSTSPNVLLVVFDTLRKDALSPYGGADTPAIARFAKDAVVYPSCIAPSPWTIPSHASMFLGKYPSEHGVHEAQDKKGRDILKAMKSRQTIAAHFRRRGYNTIGLCANPNLGPGTGFDFGFASFSYVDPLLHTFEQTEMEEEAAKLGGSKKEIAVRLLQQGKARKLFNEYFQYRDMKKLENALGYPLVKGGDLIVRAIRNTSFERPLFMFLNFMEMHEPYEKGEPDPRLVQFGLKSIRPRGVRSSYRKEALVSDRIFSRLLAHLKSSGAYDDTMIILTSDHGQCLLEHSYFGHDIFLHDELVQVPLIVKYPNGLSHKVQPGYQSLVDVFHFLRTVQEDPYNAFPSRDVVFAESFGIPYNTPFLDEKNESAHTRAIRARYEATRKAIFWNGCKLVLNRSTGEIEELTRDGKPLDPKSDPELVTRLTSLAGQSS